MVVFLGHVVNVFRNILVEEKSTAVLVSCTVYMPSQTSLNSNNLHLCLCSENCGLRLEIRGHEMLVWVIYLCSILLNCLN